MGAPRSGTPEPGRRMQIPRLFPTLPTLGRHTPHVGPAHSPRWGLDTPHVGPSACAASARFRSLHVLDAVSKTVRQSSTDRNGSVEGAGARSPFRAPRSALSREGDEILRGGRVSERGETSPSGKSRLRRLRDPWTRFLCRCVLGTGREESRVWGQRRAGAGLWRRSCRDGGARPLGAWCFEKRSHARARHGEGAVTNRGVGITGALRARARGMVRGRVVRARGATCSDL
jgi:hypothetical protein